MNLNYRNLIYSLLAVFLLVSCQQKDENAGKTPLIKVYDTYLYYEDLGELVPPGSSPEDSAYKVKSYIEIWARQQLMIKKAEINLSSEQKDVQKQLDEYRNNLLIYRYKDEFIAANLDTVVTLEQTKEYYDTHPDDFVLNNTIVKAISVQIGQTQDDYIKTVKKLLDYRNEEDSIALYDFCKQKFIKIDNFEYKWVTIPEVVKNLPEMVSEKADFIKTNGILNIKNDEFVYMLKIKSNIQAGGTMPFEMAKNQISRILINKRKTKLIIDLEQNIYDNAIESGNLEYLKNQH